MHKNSSVGYLRLAMIRNEKLYTMSFPEIQSKTVIRTSSSEEAGSSSSIAEIIKAEKESERMYTWRTTNQDLVRIENGIVVGLGNLQEEGRASLFKDISQAQINAEYEICRLNVQKIRTNEDMKQLADATKIKEAADYLELILQLHFPQEFPNPLVEEVLAIVGNLSSPTDLQNNQVNPELTEIISQVISEKQGQEDAATVVADEGTSVEEGPLFEGQENGASSLAPNEDYEGGLTSLMNDLKPTLLDKYKEAKLLSSDLTAQGSQESLVGGDSQSLDDGIGQ